LDISLKVIAGTLADPYRSIHMPRHGESLNSNVSDMFSNQQWPGMTYTARAADTDAESTLAQDPWRIESPYAVTNNFQQNSFDRSSSLTGDRLFVDPREMLVGYESNAMIDERGVLVPQPGLPFVHTDGAASSDKLLNPEAYDRKPPSTQDAPVREAPAKEEEEQPLLPMSLLDYSYEDTFSALDAHGPFTVLDLKDEDNARGSRSRIPGETRADNSDYGDPGAPRPIDWDEHSEHLLAPYRQPFNFSALEDTNARLERERVAAEQNRERLLSHLKPTTSDQALEPTSNAKALRPPELQWNSAWPDFEDYNEALDVDKMRRDMMG
jgi:hypothetical protein